MNIIKSLKRKHPGVAAACKSGYWKVFGFNHKKIKGKSNSITGRAVVKKCSFKIEGHNNAIVFGDFTCLSSCNIIINGNSNRIRIANNCCLKQASLVIEDDDNELVLGENTTINGATQIAVTEGTKVIIGRDCMFANDIVIRTGDSHAILSLENHEKINIATDVKIGSHVWLGQNVTVLKGAVISDGTVVAAGSIVTKPIMEPNVIIAGIPAKIIKRAVEWTRNK